MKKIICMLGLVLGLSSSTALMAESFNGNGFNGFGGFTHNMPEPSAIPELAAGVVGLAFVAVRRIKKPTA